MIFFTRELQDGIQHNSGWERKAMREWDKRIKFYRRYQGLIGPLIPANVRRLCRESLHDAVVVSVAQRGDVVTFVMDARGSFGGWRGYHVRLIFAGVRSRIRTRGLVRQWWVYNEVHLSSRAKFALHVLFDTDEMEIEADGLSIKRL